MSILATSVRRRVLVQLVLLDSALAPAISQCTPRWEPSSIAGTAGPVQAAVWWDRDGSGPLPPVLAVAGSFLAAGRSTASHVAWFDPAGNQWQPLGSGLGADALALVALPNGHLVVGGSFASAGGTPANHIARWDGTAWSPLGGGLNDRVHALTALPNGDVIAGGAFTTAGGAPASYVARWDGSNWSPLGAGVSNPYGSGQTPPVSCLATMPSGEVIAGGRFMQAGTVAASCIARWNGSTWSALGSGVVPTSTTLMDNPVLSLAALPTGDLVVGGEFNTAGGISAQNVALWNGTAWSALGSGIPGLVRALAPGPAGTVFAGGTSVGSVLRWNGAWASIGGPDTVYALASGPGGALAAGGLFDRPGSCVALWSGGTWGSLGVGSPNLSYLDQALAVTERNDELIVSGGFTMVTASGVADSVARWNGSAWNSLGAIFSPTPPLRRAIVSALATLANGDLVIGGVFDSAGAVGTANIARWDGSAWSSLGGGLNNGVTGLTPLPDGGLLALGGIYFAGGPIYGIARWNGTTWSALGSGIPGSVFAAVVLPGGDIVAGGGFSTAGGVPANCIARWNGTSWSALGAGLTGGVLALTVLPNGDVVAGGHFDSSGTTPCSRVARWDGITWWPLGAGMGSSSPGFTDYDVFSLLTLPDGDVLAAGAFDRAGGVPATYIARWNGTAWSAVDGGMTAGGLPPVYAAVNGLTMRRNGQVAAGGRFQGAGATPATGVALLGSSCPASARPVGSGCTGSGGLNALTPAGLPWTGGTFVSAATGMPTPGIAVFVYGMSTTPIPLASLLAQGLPGCTLSLLPVIAQAQVTSVGGATTGIAVPDSPTLAGVQLIEQVVALGTDLSGNVVQATSTNTLVVTLGTF